MATRADYDNFVLLFQRRATPSLLPILVTTEGISGERKEGVILFHSNIYALRLEVSQDPNCVLVTNFTRRYLQGSAIGYSLERHPEGDRHGRKFRDRH